MFAEEKRTKLKWFVSKDPSETSSGGSTTKKLRLDSLNSGEWEERGEGFFFIPSQADIGENNAVGIFIFNVPYMQGFL